MKKIIFIFFFIFLSAGYAYSEIIAEGAIPSSFRDNKQPLAEDIIVCELQASGVFQKDKETNKIYYIITDAHASPSIITFTGINKKPEMKTKAGNFPLRILRNDSHIITFDASSYSQDINVFYSIYKKEKIVIFHKTSLPSGMVSVGYCY